MKFSIPSLFSILLTEREVLLAYCIWVTFLSGGQNQQGRCFHYLAYFYSAVHRAPYLPLKPRTQAKEDLIELTTWKLEVWEKTRIRKNSWEGRGPWGEKVREGRGKEISRGSLTFIWIGLCSLLSGPMDRANTSSGLHLYFISGNGILLSHSTRYYEHY